MLFRVLKYLDNVVKEYSGQVSNILTAIVCAYIFPDRFEITVFIVSPIIGANLNKIGVKVSGLGWLGGVQCVYFWD